MVHARAVALDHAPTQAVLRPVHDGVELGLGIGGLTLEVQAGATLFGRTLSLPIHVGYERVEAGALARPSLADDGRATLGLGEAFVRLEAPDVRVGGADVWLAERAMGALGVLLEPLGGRLLGTVLSPLDELSLTAPLEAWSDALGATVPVQLAEVSGDQHGLGLGLAVGAEAVGPLAVQPPSTEGLSPSTHLAVSLHEGALDAAVAGPVLALLERDIPLAGGPLADLAALGGGTPCVGLSRGAAHATRLHGGLEPLATVYLPDLRVRAGTLAGEVCEGWAEVSLALEVGVHLREGTRLGLDVDVREGALLSHGAAGQWAEGELVRGVSDTVERLLDGPEGGPEVDLAALLAGLELSAVPGIAEGFALDPAVVEARSGEGGAVVVGIRLFPDP